MDQAIQEEYTERTSLQNRLCAALLTYSVGDIAGLKVSHDFDALDDGEARILTLKDSRILDNEGASQSTILWSMYSDADCF